MNKLFLIIIISVLYLLFCLALIFILPDNYVLPSLVMISFLGVFFTSYFIGKFLSKKIDKKTDLLQREIFAEYGQIESLFAIYNLLKIDSILPPFRGWAISPDFASIILKKIRNNKATQIIECGSGVSTIIICYLLKQRGSGHLYTLEHDAEYAEKTRLQLEKNNLTEYATIFVSELAPYTLNGETWNWYDMKNITEDQKFDMLIVDGPPFQIQARSRYPALPLLYKHLNDKSIVLIDDCKREEDKYVVELWLNEFKDFRDEWIETEKGAYLLTKSKN